MIKKSGTETTPGCFAGNILRVDLGSGLSRAESPRPGQWREWLGGAGLGARILYEEVPPEVGWDHPGNRLIMATGPFAGLPLWGTGGVTVVTRGAMTNGATSTQANGFFGTNLKYSGFDAIVLQGISRRWVYLYIHDGVAELRNAAHLVGRDSWETQQLLQEELGYGGHRLSVYTSGIAGENKVRFASIHGDYGHVASKNGCGAVMGAKRLKAVAIARGSGSLEPHDPAGLMQVADSISHELRTNPSTQWLYNLGTQPAVINLNKLGVLPIKNYTTSIMPAEVDKSRWEGPALRDGFAHRGHQCTGCGMHHCQQQVLNQGDNRGRIVDEPEYEGWSSGWAMGITDPETASWLNDKADRAVVDVNEVGWLMGWLMECSEKGYLTSEQLDGIEMKWGDAAAVSAMLDKVITRDGIGDLLAEGVKRASEKFGGRAAECAIYLMKGSTPRGHDHRGRWEEMLDTAVASTGTLESGQMVAPAEHGLPPRIDPFDPTAVATGVAKMLGRRHFEDSLGACIFTTRASLKLLCDALNAATGWDYTPEEAMAMGRRTAVYLRAFNLRAGIGPELERPSARYGSVPADGPAAGHDVGAHWESMLRTWYELVEYDQATGRPRRELLQRLGMPEVERDLWGAE